MNYTVQIRTSSQAARLLRDHLDDLDHEELWGIYLTGGGYLINAEMLTKGTLTCTPIDARTVIKRALMNNAAAVSSRALRRLCLVPEEGRKDPGGAPEEGHAGSDLRLPPPERQHQGRQDLQHHGLRGDFSFR